MTCFVHHVPGRLRIKIAKIKHQKNQAEKIRDIFSGIYGIDNVSVNILTGSIVIYYDPSVFSIEKILNILRHNRVIDSIQPLTFQKPVSERSTQMGMAIGKALFSWVVGRALERSGLGFLAVFI